MMLRELSGALASMADGPHDERRNSLELLNNILEVLSRDNVVRHSLQLALKLLSSFIQLIRDMCECIQYALGTKRTIET